jgi:tRNA nucleotidyltransferase (CCA-adding enzyme)
MRAYRVGGSVRDELLGLPVVDRDWVVVGATPQQMIDQGFRPVGRDFPVFLHPDSKEEFALARTERKTGPGYKGFAVHFEPGVTLEEDLARRDLTINAMAKAEDGSLIDPFGGRRDLQDRVLRHVSDSFVEDPVRILRLARFAARFADFAVAPETMALTRRMTAAGEVDALVAERVWQELARGLQEARPSRMIAVLEETGALRVLLPELQRPPGDAGDEDGEWSDWLDAIDRCAARQEPLAVCYAVLMSRAGGARAGQGRADGAGALGVDAAGDDADGAAADGADAAGAAERAVLRASHRLRVPTECRELASLLTRERETARATAGVDLLRAMAAMSAPALLRLLDRCDAWRRPARLAGLLHAAAAIEDVDPELDPGAARLKRALRAANRVDQAAIARRLSGEPGDIREAISRERLRRIADEA